MWGVQMLKYQDVYAADRRARGLPALYQGKLAAINRQYYGTVEGEVGPCQER